ncbi:YqzL family protein [Pseudalkalibacillus decolorationis]|nr:YqzL family protein [Pseudalkalibacillus decolorationis]
MRDFTWKLFCVTGNIDTYLLLRELDDEHVVSNDLVEGDEGNSDFVDTEL